MKFHLKKLAMVGLLVVTTAYAATVLSPNQNNQSGQIPSGYADLSFKVSDGNWTKNLYLPTQPKNGDLLTIESNAGYKTYVDTLKSDLPVDILELSRGDAYTFKYSATEKLWKIQVSEQFPTNGVSQATVEVGKDKVSKFVVADGQWTGTIRLPDQAVDGQFIAVESRAAYNTKIDTSNLLFNSNFNLKRGQTYWFKYNNSLQKWIPEQIQPLAVDVRAVNTSKPETAVTALEFGATTISQVNLPTQANDRDRIIVTSTGARPKKINSANLATKATMSVNKGDRFEFMYVADKAHWVLVSAPETKYSAYQFSSGVIPEITKPVTRVTVTNNNYLPVINLPSKAQIDDKIIVNSTANNSFDIAATGLNRKVVSGEKVRFVYTASGWQVASNTIDILLVNSLSVSDTLGKQASKIRLLESMSLTNETAENSDANFYVRHVGYLNYTIPTPDNDLNTALTNSRDDKTIQNERKRLKADGVLYQGTEGGKGCGWAYVKASSYNMTANQNLACGITAARHEFGHNLGVHHDDYKDGSNRGFNHSLGSTALGGNSLPYYSSPNSYSPKYGVRLGEEGVTDALKAINAHAPTVSAYY